MTIANHSVTPMMAQYLEIKSGYPDALLFYRMGDFYELFFDDAIKAAAALDITLTKRGKHLGEDIPMCGVPVHAAEGYLLTLIRKGFRVAVGEQMENPAEAKKRGSKSVVRREVVRLVTPGTLSEDALLDARRHNFLASFAEVRGVAALAWIDMSTCEFWVQPCAPEKLGPELARLLPRELLVSETSFEFLSELVSDFEVSLTAVAPSSFDSTSGLERLKDVLQVETLDAFGSFERAEISAMSGLVNYLEITQRGKLPHLRPPKRELEGGFLQMDAATRRNLELTQKLSGGRDGSLLSALDRTETAAGGRLLAQRISSPSRELNEIRKRHDRVEALANAQYDLATLRETSVPSQISIALFLVCRWIGVGHAI